MMAVVATLCALYALWMIYSAPHRFSPEPWGPDWLARRVDGVMRLILGAMGVSLSLAYDGTPETAPPGPPWPESTRRSSLVACMLCVCVYSNRGREYT